MYMDTVSSLSAIRTACIGLGYRGKQLFDLLRQIPFFRVVAVADPCLEAKDVPVGIACYGQGPDDYRRMLDEQRPQLVVVASPWAFHVPHALDCLRAGCHVALEIKGGLAVGEYAPLSELVRQTGLRLFPLENTLFRRDILAVHTMVQAGVLGEIVHMQGGYRHDLRDLLLDDEGHLGNRRNTESVWRARFYQEGNGDVYPTHGLAPLCLIGGINRTDRMLRLTSFASKPAGLRHRIRELGGDDRVRVTLGDVVITQLETEHGVLVTLTHDTTLPRPRSLDFEVQGTKGLWQGDTHRIYVEGPDKAERWEDDAPWLARYEHPYWTRWGREALEADRHHEGMDYVMLKAVEEDLAGGLSYPATVDDLALWTAVTPLSGRSIAGRCTVDFLHGIGLVEDGLDVAVQRAEAFDVHQRAQGFGRVHQAAQGEVVHVH